MLSTVLSTHTIFQKLSRGGGDYEEGKSERRKIRRVDQKGKQNIVHQGMIDDEVSIKH